MKGRERIAAVILMVLALALLLGMAAEAQGTRETIRTLYVGSLTVTNSIASNGEAAFARLAADGLTAQAGVVGQLVLTPAGAITVTNGMTLTPTVNVHPLAAAGAVTATLGGCRAGLMVTLYNVTTPTITIADSGAGVLAGNVALGQGDTLTLVGSGTACHQVGTANN